MNQPTGPRRIGVLTRYLGLPPAMTRQRVTATGSKSDPWTLGREAARGRAVRSARSRSSASASVVARVLRGVKASRQPMGLRLRWAGALGNGEAPRSCRRPLLSRRGIQAQALEIAKSRCWLTDALQHSFERPHGDAQQSADFNRWNLTALGGAVRPIPAQTEISFSGLGNGDS